MSVFENFAEVINGTEEMQSLLHNLEEEPATLLASICREFEATGQEVPDHHFNLAGYFAEAAIKMLLSAGMVSMKPGKFSLYEYKPTEAGLRYYHGMLSEKKG
ncbi:MAG: hypothetical protein J7J88_03220 [Dehalococcoidia bacterium]|nr:hypothetical protein [Dehalococcoidia bacterium]